MPSEVITAECPECGPETTARPLHPDGGRECDDHPEACETWVCTACGAEVGE